MYEYYVRDEHMQHTEIAAIKFDIYSIIENKRARYKKFMLLIDFCVRRKKSRKWKVFKDTLAVARTIFLFSPF